MCMGIFKKDKDNKDKDNKEHSQHARGRSTTSGVTSSSSSSSTPIFNLSHSGSADKGEKALGLLSISGGNSVDASRRAQSAIIQGNSASVSTSVRIGETRTSTKVICRAKALYDYPLDGDTLQVEEGEIKLLKFKKGDIINVHEQDVSGWWSGEFNEEKGVFPGSYMKVLTDEPPPEQATTKKKSQNVPREELMKKVTDLIKQLEDLETERDELRTVNERLQEEYTKRVQDLQTKHDAEMREMKNLLAERDEFVQASTKRMQQMETELEQVHQKLSTREVEMLTMELEIAEHKNKSPDPHYDGKKTIASSKGLQRDMAQQSAELESLTKQKMELDKSVREAQAKLSELETKILRKVMSTPAADDSASESKIKDKEKQIDLLKKQLGEEVFERRRLENEVRDMKRAVIDYETLKADKQRLEAEVAAKADADTKLGKINIILQGLVNKDDATMTVSSMKEVLSKVRKGIATSAPSTPTSSSAGVSASSTAGGSPSADVRPVRKPHSATMSYG